MQPISPEIYYFMSNPALLVRCQKITLALYWNYPATELHITTLCNTTSLATCTIRPVHSKKCVSSFNGYPVVPILIICRSSTISMQKRTQNPLSDYDGGHYLLPILPIGMF